MYLARRGHEDEGECQNVAVKMFWSSQLNDAEHESGLLEPLVGAVGIVQLHEVIHSLDFCALVLEYSPRGNLHSYLASFPCGEVPCREESEGILQGMLVGMAALHDRRIVHLDVKKDNVLLTPDGGAMWCDLGEARELPAPIVANDEKEDPSSLS